MSRGNDQFDRARDELFSHIHRCGVLRAVEQQQQEWMDDTVEYLSERFPELSGDELGELRTIGLRFCRPVIDHTQEVESQEQDGDHSAEAEAAAA